jgi:hypothetical protein
MMEAVHTSETSVDNNFTRQYNPEDNSEHHAERKILTPNTYLSKYDDAERRHGMKKINAKREAGQVTDFSFPLMFFFVNDPVH